jgi:signal transduction histidine kinase
MRLGIKGKQVLYVTSIVGGVVVVLSLMHMARLARVSLEESRSRAELLANAIFQRARQVVEGLPAGTYPSEALRHDAGLRSILESSLYDRNVTFAAVADSLGFAVAHADPTREGLPVVGAASLDDLLTESSGMQLRAIYSDEGRNLMFRKPLFLNGNVEFGSIRIGVSTLLIRDDLNASLGSALVTALLALGSAVVVAMLLAQLFLRPIHMIRSGLTRLGKGEFGVRLDLDQQDEFGELGSFFNAVSAQLSADRSQMAGQVANLESAVERLEDAVAIVSPRGTLLFANPAMRALVPDAVAGAQLERLVSPDHPMQRLTEQTLASRQSRGPIAATFSETLAGEPVSGERLIHTHPVNDAKGDLVGIMLIVRNLEYLSQVQSTVRYSRKLVALGRLSAGVAHEVKNPLNAMMIHLELLRQQFTLHAPVVERRAAAAGPVAETAAAVATAVAPPVNDQALKHVDVIAAEIRRLDEVVQGFLKFSRPEDLKLQPVRLSMLLDEVIPIVRPEADRMRVELAVDCRSDLDVNGDPAMLRQAFLNLALNSCQAMPNGGTLTIRCTPARRGRVSITFGDTGVGIAPENLNRIFDLYFTTREKGSGIGLSMVYRTVQMHDGEIEVQSTPGKGTTFRLLLPEA